MTIEIMQISEKIKQNRITASLFSLSTIIIFIVIGSVAIFIFLFLENSMLIIPAAAFVFFTYLFSVLKPVEFSVVTDFCFRYRWVLSLMIFILCVVLKLNGSSIEMFNAYLPTRITGDTGVLFGKCRTIRSDEWAVQTPIFFSQFYNNFGLFSNQMSMSPTNMVINYYSPVWDITILGKPLAWGYLLFCNEIGLSWYWCGQFILLFMVSQELFLIITENSKVVSISGAIMICLSPNIQWWFLPHMPIVILYAESLFVVGYYFFTAENIHKRWLFSGLSIIVTTGFGLSIFPSFQVPCTYIVVALLAACLYRDRKFITFFINQWYTIAIPIISVGLIMTHFYGTSKDALTLVMDSVYPGKRISVGGDHTVSVLFTDLSSLTLPYKDISYLNNCEVSSYIHFAPFFMILSPRLFISLKRNGKNAALGYVLLTCNLLLAYYMIIGIPEWLASITLLKYCNRMASIYGWSATLFSVWGISILLRYPKILGRKQQIFYLTVYAVTYFLIIDEDLLNYLNSMFSFSEFGIIFAIIEILILSSILGFATVGNRKLMNTLLVAVMVLCGATVNPIQRGTSAITDHPVCAVVSEITVKDSDSLWLNCTDTSFLSNLLAANGAKILSATNYYYDIEKWNLIDSEGKYEEYTNRYSNQIAKIVTNHNYVELPFPDQICFYITPETVKALGIRYLFSQEDYTSLFSEYNISCQFVTGQDGYYIYKLQY